MIKSVQYLSVLRHFGKLVHYIFEGIQLYNILKIFKKIEAMMEERKSSLMSDDVMSQKVEIFMSARKIVHPDNILPINSFVVVQLSEPGKQKKRILTTKTYQNTPDPNYAESIVLDFCFQIKQKLTFQIYNESKGTQLIGSVETTVGEIFGSPSNGLTKNIVNFKNIQIGKLIIRCQKVQEERRKIIQMQIMAQNLPNFKWMWFFGGTNTFFRIFRKRKNDQLLLYQSQVINNTQSPQWKKIQISESKLCRNDDRLELQLRVYQHSKKGNHTLIGTSFFNVKKILQKQRFKIVDKKGDVGIALFKNIKKTSRYQFGDFIEHGLQLALMTCIDFTSSNGNQQSKNSLHFSTPNSISMYEKAMSEVIDILMDYDYDKLVPCYGFGACCFHPQFNTKGKVHHCFPLNFDDKNAQLYQKDGIIKAYRTAINYLKFSGPTYFSQILRNAMQICQEFQQNEFKTQYMILFIMTDGQIHDKAQVKDLLVKCNRLPMSVIIVGVGKNDFEIMYELDDDDCQMIDSQGNKTERDLVQFVQFQKFKNNSVQLARQVLYELPRQISDYFELMGIEPKEMKRRICDIEEQVRLNKYFSRQVISEEASQYPEV